MYLPTVKLEIAAGELALYDADVTDVYTVRDSVTVYFRKDNVRIRVSLPLETFVGALRKIGPEVREYVDRARTALNDLRDVDALLAALPMAVPEAAEVVRVEPAEERAESGEFIEVEPAQEGDD